MNAQGWPGFREALAKTHEPAGIEASGPEQPGWQRLAFDELLASQLALALARGTRKRGRGTAWQFEGRLRAKIEGALPFSLTPAQAKALDEIAADLAGSDRMLRLLQGDVGSGKTVVALLAMASVVEGGGQAALMAPTELLARQHFGTIARMAAHAGIEAVLLTGKDRAAERAETEGRIASGAARIVIGTHALFQAGVEFHRLGLVVVDEQHRFGVHQRLALSRKGDAPDVLVMTATPIPRTLVLSYFGDMEVSQLTGKPAGRQPIDTRVVSLERLEEVVERIGQAIDAGGKAYWVCPLVAESEKVDAAAAEERFAELKARFGSPVGLVHGRMSPADKDAVMERFRAGEIRLLVSTTVIEVGVDVPDATIMVIEQAERFGLAQLHQLRGRWAVARRGRAVCCSSGHRWAKRRGRAFRSCGRPRMVFASPRRICGCAAKATCSAHGSRACPVSGSPGRRCMASCWPWRATRPSWRWRAIRSSRPSGLKRCGCCSISSGGMMRSG
jgi:ATP-dependent DNA helicase RecG